MKPTLRFPLAPGGQIDKDDWFPVSPSPLMSALRALTIQLIAAALTCALLRLGVLSGLPWLALAAIQGSFAATLAFASRSASWWIFIHLFFMPAIALIRLAGMPSWFWATAFIALMLVYWTCFVTRVPLFLSNTKTTAELAQALPCGPLRVLDIGSGTGSFVREFARLRPDSEVHGIEAAPAPAFLARHLARKQANAHLVRGDFFAADWSRFDVVYAFLSPAPMARVWEKAREELRPGAVLISNSFPIPDQEEAGVLEVADRRKTRLHCYTIRADIAQGKAARYRIWPRSQV